MNWIKRLTLCAGFRGGVLLFLSISYLFHGLFLVAAKHSVVPPGGDTVWGTAFIVVSLFMLTGVFRRADRLPYAAAVFTMTLWSLEYFLRNIIQPYSWATGLMWLSVAVVVTLVSTWPEPYWVEVRRRIYRDIKL